LNQADQARPPRRPTSPDGMLVVNKPPGVTSHDVVAQLRRLCGTRAVGHGGTLDPMATGVLICGIGKGTKLLTYVSGADKAYSAIIRLGIATTTDDAEGEITSAVGATLNDDNSSSRARGKATPDFIGAPEITPESLTNAINQLTGDIQQIPTAVSAIKVNGERAYNLVRQGKEVELAARPVTVSRFEVTDTIPSMADGVPVIDLKVNVVVSSGTYVRALARDLGAALGIGGHLTMLQRTRIGKVDLEMAQTIAHLEDAADFANKSGQGLPTMPLAQAAELFLPTRQITTQEAKDLTLGKFISQAETDKITAAIGPNGQLVAIIEPVNATAGNNSAKAKPKVVFGWNE